MKQVYLTRNFIAGDNVIDYLVLLEKKAKKNKRFYDKEHNKELYDKVSLEQLLVKLSNLKHDKVDFYNKVEDFMLKFDEEFVISNAYYVLQLLYLDEKDYDSKNESNLNNLSVLYVIANRARVILRELCENIIKENEPRNLRIIGNSVVNDPNFRNEIYKKLSIEFDSDSVFLKEFMFDFSSKCGVYAHDYLTSRVEEILKTIDTISNNRCFESARNAMRKRQVINLSGTVL